MNRKPVDMYQDPTIAGHRAASQALLAELLTGSVDVADLLERIQAQQIQNDDENLYAEPWARQLENAMSGLRLALEAAGRRQ